MQVAPPTSLTAALRPAREAFFIWIALTACAVTGVWMGGQYGERKLAEAMRSDAIDSARAAALGIDPAFHTRVAQAAKMWSDEHKRALAPLIAFHQQYPDVSRVRTFVQQGDQVVVVLDTETVAGAVGMKRPVDPLELRMPLDKSDPAYNAVQRTLETRQPSTAARSQSDEYRTYLPGVVPLGSDAAVESELTSSSQESTLSTLHTWVRSGIGIAVIACGAVALIYFNVRSAHFLSETAGGEAKRNHEWLEQRSRRLVQALGQIVLHRDLNAGCLLWDGDTEAILGTSLERMPRDFEEWMQRMHPEDEHGVREASARTSPKRPTYEIEYRIKHDKEERWVWLRERGVVTYEVTSEQGKAPAALIVDSVIEDVSLLKQEHEELAALALIASRTDNAVCLTDPEGRVRWTNVTFQNLTGHASQDSRGRRLSTLFASAPGEPTFSKLLDGAIAGESGRGELELANREGKPYWAKVEFHPLKDESGRISRLVAIQSDITAAKEFEARLVRARDAAEAADRAKSEFLAVMSHEIRTPLNAVLGFTRLLLDTPLTQQQRDYIDTIRSSGDNLLHLLNDILDFSKMDANGMQLDHEPFDLTGCVEEALDVLISPATARGLELVADIAFDVPAAVIGDRGRLRQILLNLAGNGVKFTERGEIAISVRLKSTALNAAHIRFEVRDTGPGISLEQQEQLFKPFTQADSSATRKHGGTGLGLAISKRLVTLMGGTIGVQSSLGAGSTFWFEVPLEMGEKPRPAGPCPELQGLRVLLVEKNSAQRRVLSDQLARQGLQVEAFARGRDAIFASEQRRFDIAIVDANPPDIDGLALIDRFRHSPRRNVGGIILTGPPGRLPAISPNAFDGVHRLVKPIHAAALLQTLLRAAPRIARPPVAVTAAPSRIAPKPAGREDLAPGAPVGRRILVADDNAINRKLVKKMLDGLGYSPALVTNGLECVEAVKKGEFDAILMDIQMPEMDGLAAAKAIRELGSAIPIIALTADAMPDDRARCLAAGMNDYLQKPVRSDALEAALDRAAAPA